MFSYLIVFFLAELCKNYIYVKNPYDIQYLVQCHSLIRGAELCSESVFTGLREDGVEAVFKFRVFKFKSNFYFLGLDLRGYSELMCWYQQVRS